MTYDWKSFTRSRKVTSPTWYSKDWGLFAYSFKKSADLVYSEYVRVHQDAYWYPAMYLYRQWMELCLKNIWSATQRFDKQMPNIPWKHELSPLWTTLKPWLERESVISSGDEFIASAERIFGIFDQIDPKGTAYRYPPLTLPHADIINFSLKDFEAAIDQIDTVFFGIFNLLNEYEEGRAAAFLLATRSDTD
jgi:hypothetical protein